MNEKTYRRILIALLSALALLLVAAAAIYLTRGSTPAAKPSAAKETPAAPAATTGAPVEKEDERAPGPKVIDASDQQYADTAKAFIRAYATPGPRKQWLESLKPYSSPAFYASLQDSDIDLAQGLGDEVISSSQGRVVIGKDGQAQATLTLRAISDEGELLPPLVETIDFAKDLPRDAQPPLSSDSRDSVKENLQVPMAYLIGQEATLTDQARNERLQLAFITPRHVLEIPRVAPAGTPVRIGNITDLQFLAT
ncbi:hypothetical protein ACUH95_06350, partial [Dermabacteraceae bacterium P13101]